MPGRPPRPSDADLVHLIRSGNREAGDMLVNRHAGLVRRLVGRMYPLPPGIDRDDLIQAGLLAVYETAAKLPPTGWDHKGGTRFSTYCYTAIGWAIRKEVCNRPGAVMESDLTARLDDDAAGLAGFPERIPVEPPDLSPVLSSLNPLELCVVSVLYDLDGRRVGVPDLKRRVGINDLSRKLGMRPAKVRAAIDSAHVKMRWREILYEAAS